MNLDIIPSSIVEKRGVAGDISSSLRVQTPPPALQPKVFTPETEINFVFPKPLTTFFEMRIFLCDLQR